jgi:hypothetical protein
MAAIEFADKLVPVIVTTFAPDGVPNGWDIDVIVIGSAQAYKTVDVSVPAPTEVFVTRMTAVPTVPAGVTHWTLVSLDHTIEVAGFPPNVIPVISVMVVPKSVPVMVTVCPPDEGPNAGDTPVTIAGAIL